MPLAAQWRFVCWFDATCPRGRPALLTSQWGSEGFETTEMPRPVFKGKMELSKSGKPKLVHESVARLAAIPRLVLPLSPGSNAVAAVRALKSGLLVTTGGKRA